MKLALVCFLVLSMACSSICAVAEGPIPIRALMQSAAATPSSTPRSESQNAPAVSQPAPHSQMTTGGKVMTGVGIGFLALGVVALAQAPGEPKDSIVPARGITIATGLLFAGVGTTLVVLGTHRRKAK